MTDIIAEPGSLAAILAAAKPGDDIWLAPGNYGDVTLRRRTFAEPLTLRPADPARPPSLRSLALRECSGLAFLGLGFAFTPDMATVTDSSVVYLDKCTDVRFIGGEVTSGPAINGVPAEATILDATGNVIGFTTCRGFTIQNNLGGIFVEGLDVHHLHRGVVIGGGRGVTIRRLAVHHLRKSGIMGGCSDLLIEQNHLHTSNPWRYGQTPNGDHGDWIPLWNGGTEPLTNIKVLDNRMETGAGSPMMGGWVQGKIGGVVGYTYRGNSIIGGDHQGLILDNVHDGEVANNVFLQDLPDGKDIGFIIKDTTSKLSIGDNIAGSVSNASTANTLGDNYLIQRTKPTATGYIGAALLSALKALGTPAEIYTATLRGVTVPTPPVIEPEQPEPEPEPPTPEPPVTAITYEDLLYLQKVWEAKINDTPQEVRISAHIAELVAALTPIPVPADVWVKDSASFVAALATAKPGSVIVIPKGVAIAQLKLSKQKYDPPIKIIGGGSLTNTSVTECEGITFDGLELITSGTGGILFPVTKSKRLTFKNCDIHGSLDGNPQNDGAAFSVTLSEDISFIDNVFRQVDRCIIANNCKNTVVTGNDMSELRTDGMMFAEMDTLLISGNAIGNYSPVAGAHPDGIQFMTAGTDVSCNDITIADNVIYRDADLSKPGPSMQGIFLGNEDDIPFNRVTITGNLLLGTGYRGVSVSHGKDVVIKDNELLGQAQVLKDKLTGVANGIYATGCDQVVIENNKTCAPIGLSSTAAATDTSTNVSQKNNVTTLSRSSTPEQIADAWKRWKDKGGIMPRNLAI